MAACRDEVAGRAGVVCGCEGCAVRCVGGSAGCEDGGPGEPLAALSGSRLQWCHMDSQSEPLALQMKSHGQCYQVVIGCITIHYRTPSKGIWQ